MAEYICPNCGKPIYDEEALRCLYCGESLRRGFGFMGRMKYPTPRVIMLVCVIILLLSFVILISR